MMVALATMVVRARFTKLNYYRSGDWTGLLLTVCLWLQCGHVLLEFLVHFPWIELGEILDIRSLLIDKLDNDSISKSRSLMTPYG